MHMPVRSPIIKSKATLRAVKVDGQKLIIRKGDPTKPRWWRVTLGKKFTGTKKHRRFFATEREANAFITETSMAKKKKGHLAFAIPNSLAVEAAELEQRDRAQHQSASSAVGNPAVKNTTASGSRIASSSASKLAPRSWSCSSTEGRC
jgi:hypothetical protein